MNERPIVGVQLNAPTRVSFVEGLKLSKQVGEEEKRRIAQAVREACVRAALEGYERAGVSGLCDEGRWEMAIDSIRSLDLEPILRHIPTEEAT